MKIKLDFVSNSSSTSFVYISNEELSEEAFLEAAGVEPDSPVAVLFCQMHSEIKYSIDSYGTKLISKEAVDKFSGGHEFTPDVIEKMKDAIDRGVNVVTAKLSSEGHLAESALCMAIFEIKSDRFYINAYNNYW